MSESFHDTWWKSWIYFLFKKKRRKDYEEHIFWLKGALRRAINSLFNGTHFFSLSKCIGAMLSKCSEPNYVCICHQRFIYTVIVKKELKSSTSTSAISYEPQNIPNNTTSGTGWYSQDLWAPAAQHWDQECSVGFHPNETFLGVWTQWGFTLNRHGWLCS